MKNTTSHHADDRLEQLGGTDQIEQLAADLAVKDDREKVTDKDREQALKQMRKMSPPAPPAEPPSKSPERGDQKL